MAIGALANALTAQGRHIIRLNLGEPDTGAPPAVLESLQNIADGRPLPYTDAMGLPALREAIAQDYQRRDGVTIDPTRICITAGASGALTLATAALVNPGDHVMIADPSYPCNRQFIHTFGGHVDLVPTSEHTRFQLTPDLVETHWTPETRGILIATPSNPTGTSVPTEDMQNICQFAADHGGFRIIDEIYLALSGDCGPTPSSAAAWDTGAFIINSFSKYCGMTGWRLGWCVVPESLVEAIDRLSQNLFLCASTPAQMAALSCFSQESLEWCEARRAEFARRRNAAVSALEAIGLPVAVRPDGAFYVYADVSSTGLSAAEFARQALDLGVAVTPGEDFGPLTADSHIRISCSASVDDIQEGISRLSPLVAGV